MCCHLAILCGYIHITMCQAIVNFFLLCSNHIIVSVMTFKCMVAKYQHKNFQLCLQIAGFQHAVIITITIFKILA